MAHTQLNTPCRLGHEPGNAYHSIFGRVQQRWQRRPPCLGGPHTRSSSCLRTHEAARTGASLAVVQNHLADCVLNASIHQDLQSVEELGSLLPAWRSLLKSKHAVRVPSFSRWHVEMQEQLFRHLRRLWRDDVPRVMVDLGCHAGHGRFKNRSDALLWLGHFSHAGSLVIGVDAFEDFALDLQHRFDAVEPYRSMRDVRKIAVARAVSATDRKIVDLRRLAQQVYGCCRTMNCFSGMSSLEQQGLHDHVCRIPRQRLFPHASPSRLDLPPSSYDSAVITAARAAQLSPVPYPVTTTRTDTLWRELAGGRRIDFLKIDVDKGWADMVRPYLPVHPLGIPSASDCVP